MGVLLKKNILLGKPSTSKEQVLREMGKLLADGGYTTDKYTDALFEKEKVFNTYLGNSLAIPHGVESMRSEILGSGIAIFTYPDGVDWGDGNIAKLVIGVASVGDDHVQTLSNIAMACSTQEAVDKILTMNVDEIYEIFKG
ncbi:PTS sugar transporter subunit IIA [Butyrivibrio sp. MC2013]|uniref:PTS sugar transporter subunit IIA n=1 Tax=Butyrivibrio sp. MC2013 TaxID=1280686 RepID=UPI0003FEA9EA|nr:PTS sugar transporter subunit IIA [Butyrivibrio sp. MC2013]